MERDAYQDLVRWKARLHRKPLVIMGARQVGKTWLMEEFGRREYASTVRLAFNEDDQLERRLFPDQRAAAVVERLEIWLERRIDPATTLIVLDEIQEAPAALAALKSFAETAPEYHVVAAGSLLGVSLHAETSFPVGKVEFLDLHPLTFSEFLRALGRGQLDAAREKGKAESFADELTRLLKTYYLVGGMPEAVASYAADGDLARVRAIQQTLVRAYDLDVSKHAPNEMVPRIRAVFGSAPRQLAEAKKFTYGQVEPGARARSHELAIEWLLHAGLVHRVARVAAPRLPLAAYADPAAFKLYLIDIGLLACLSGLAPATVLDDSAVFTEFKGALTEQYVLQEFIAAAGLKPYYWANDRSQAEVDFVVEIDGRVVPVEAKAGLNLRAKSLRAFTDRFDSAVAVRTSLAGRRDDGLIVNLPLWQVDQVAEAVRAYLKRTDPPAPA